MRKRVKLTSIIILISAGLFYLKAQNFNLYNTEEKFRIRSE